MSEAPAVAAAHETYGDQVTFVGMAGRSERGAQQAFVADLGLDQFPHAIDPDGTVWSAFAIVSQPAFVFIDDSGTATSHLGPLGAEALATEVERLIDN